MKTLQRKQITTSAAVIALIILVKWILPLGLNLLTIRLPDAARITLFLCFPHEVLDTIKYPLAMWTRSYTLSYIPLFSILFAVFLMIAFVQFRDKQKKLPLQVACYILLVSIVISIPTRIAYYQRAVKEYSSYVPPVDKGSGILALMDDFAQPAKPSLSLLITELAILLAYIGWAVWVLSRLYGDKTDDQSVNPDAR
ncbi:hypothetical protein [Chitinophaga pinensis]|uniref:Uncharacterized protein n=1 Tax=Chitinophaga pinensis (strain ATCC 43595 / DSM 2588 / LMG 13176 / NBRC 15968 / NCIMB 11800 / UQM 2034) TaxID=485918 RepID=A0A979G3Y9_CHIPD|nr:hypothetical protein [Chitinophaga pinensis]ACU60375.1 hypothetical protein Cpin_2896 [Chitinophaga pinensis DSM 2588]